jgi:hypothetical protein
MWGITWWNAVWAVAVLAVLVPVAWWLLRR